MATTKKSLVALGIVGILTFCSFILAVQAQQSMDMMSCGDAKMTTIVESQELTIMGLESRGIDIDNLASKAFDNMTYHAVGLYKIDSGKLTGIIYNKYMDPSEDYFVVEVSQVGMKLQTLNPD